LTRLDQKDVTGNYIK